MKFPAVVAALVLLECVAALPAPPPHRRSGGAAVSAGRAPAHKGAGVEPQGRAGDTTTKAVSSGPVPNGELKSATASPLAAKAATTNPDKSSASPSDVTKHSLDTSSLPSGITAKSVGRSDVSDIKSPPNPTGVAAKTAATPTADASPSDVTKHSIVTSSPASSITAKSIDRSDVSDTKSTPNPTGVAAKTAATPSAASSSPSDVSKYAFVSSSPVRGNTAKSVERSNVSNTKSTPNPTGVAAKAAETTPQTRTTDQTLPKSANPTAQTTKTVDSQSSTAKPENRPKRATAEPLEVANPSNVNAKAPIARSADQPNNNQPSGPAARTETPRSARRPLPQTNAASRAASTHRRAAVAEKSLPSPPKASEISGPTDANHPPTTKSPSRIRDNRESVRKTDQERPSRAIIKPNLFAKPKVPRGAITKAPSKTTPRPVLPENHGVPSGAPKGNVPVPKHKRSTRAVIPPSTQTPHLIYGVNATERIVEPTEKPAVQLIFPTPTVEVTGKSDASPESIVNTSLQSAIGFTKVLGDVVKAFISTTGIKPESEKSTNGNSNHSAENQHSTETVKTTPPSTTTTQVPTYVTSQTTGKPSIPADSSTGEARIIPGLVGEHEKSTSTPDTSSTLVTESGPAISLPADLKSSVTSTVGDAKTTSSSVPNKSNDHEQTAQGSVGLLSANTATSPKTLSPATKSTDKPSIVLKPH